MQVRLLTEDDSDRYDLWLENHSAATLWQSRQWEKYQDSLARETRIYLLEEKKQILASALVIIDTTSFGFSVWDIPCGPLGEKADQLMETITKDAKRDKALSIFLSPRKELDTKKAMKKSSRHEQPEATRLIDLLESEEEILAQMKQKGRYNIRVAEKHGVTVEESDDVDAFYKMMEKTSERDAFTPLSRKQYLTFLQKLDGSYLLIARDKKQKAIGGLLGVIWGESGTYYYGASSYAERALMAPYLLQWKSMQFCKDKGAKTYDLLGVAPPDAPSSHPWSGITSFKEKFGGVLCTYPKEKQIVVRPLMKFLLDLKRKII